MGWLSFWRSSGLVLLVPYLVIAGGFWADAVVCSSIKVFFVYYLPGIFASTVALMFNCVKKEDVDYSPYEE